MISNISVKFGNDAPIGPKLSLIKGKTEETDVHTYPHFIRVEDMYNIESDNDFFERNDDDISSHWIRVIS